MTRTLYIDGTRYDCEGNEWGVVVTPEPTDEARGDRVRDAFWEQLGQQEIEATPGAASYEKWKAARHAR